MTLFFLIVALCVAFQAERGIFDTLSYFRLAKELEKKASHSKHSKKILFLLIPVLREQEIIVETILRFCRVLNQNFEIKVALLTSIRENSNKGAKNLFTTEEVIHKSIESGALSEYKNQIHIFQDPTVQGNMATQLNFAIKEIRSFSDSNTLYMVYNADSIISETTFSRLSTLLDDNPNMEFAFQQPCAFVKDMDTNSNQFTNAMSLYQSWYCLGHESRLIRKHDSRIRKLEKGEENKKLGVVVGHGSGMTLGINIENKGYPTDLLTEDLTFGFMLSAKNIPILSLPALEIADVPSRFSIFIKQKSVWFWNFLGYPTCYKKMLKQGHLKSQMIPLLLQGIGAGAYWFFDTFFIIIPFVLAALLKSYLLTAIALLSYVIFYAVPQYILLQKLPTMLKNQGFPDFAEKVQKISFFKLFPSLVLITLTNSVGAWIATVKSINFFWTGKLPVKYKTGD